VKPESEIYWHLAQRLGLEAQAVAEVIPAPGDAATEAFVEERLRRATGLTLADVRERPSRAPGCADVAFADLRFPTPSGRIELESEEARRRWGQDPLPTYVEPVESTRGQTGVSRYPLNLLTPNTKNRIHSQFGNLPSIRALSPQPVVFVHPADANARGLRPGGRVRVFNDRGALTLAWAPDFGLRRGCVAIHNGWWLTDGGAVNVLSKSRETDMGYGAAFHENLVEVERA
jgi:anaerobic selenocysteine-containing dehydrogenase